MAGKAKAPSVAANERRRAKEGTVRQGDRVVSIKFRGDVLRLSLFDLGPGDDEVSRRQAGFAISGQLMGIDADEVGIDTVLRILWFARRKNGERSLSWAELRSEYATYGPLIDDLGGDLMAALTFDTGTDDEEDDDPKDQGSTSDSSPAD